MSPEEEKEIKRKIVAHQGLYKQIKDSGKYHIYTKGKFSLDGFKEVIEEFELSQWRDQLDEIAVLIRNDGRITDEEFTQIKAMIHSDDQHNIYMVEQILKFKAGESQEP